MCGIVGILGKSEVTDRIVRSLKLLEYRGYDSAGIAIVSNDDILVRKVAGRIDILSTSLKDSPLKGLTGIGHTRWATHGAPEERNAHPFKSNGIALAHNGIIENHAELKERLLSQGFEFESDTDSEVLLKLIESYYKSNTTPYDAVRRAFHEVKGALAVAIIFSHNDNLMIGMRNGAPLAIGVGDGEMYLGSDALALNDFTDQIVYLDDGEIVEVSREGYKITDYKGREVKKEVREVYLDLSSITKGTYDQYMIKEIFEQSSLAERIFNKYYDLNFNSFNFDEMGLNFKNCSRLYIVACGTSYHAAFVAKYWFEKFAKIPTEIDFASEFRYRHPILDKNGAGIFISQSGETADTLAALRHVGESGLKTISIVNVEESTIAHESDHVLPLCAGYEIGVASTKAFTAQLIILALMVLDAGFEKKVISKEKLSQHLNNLLNLPRSIAEALALSPQILEVAHSIKTARSLLYTGRGTAYPIALEGALKIKEISYIHAEAMAAGELKHGSIALIDEHMPIIVIAPHNELFSKTASNIQEISARKGKVIALTDEKGAEELHKLAKFILKLPTTDEFTAPVIYTIPMQLLAYHTAIALDRDVDKPRNLAKSVTVE